MEKSKPNNAEDAGSNKPQPGSADKTDMLQYENLIDPGNEHHHHADDEKNPDENNEARFDAAGDSNTGPSTKTE